MAQEAMAEDATTQDAMTEKMAAEEATAEGATAAEIPSTPMDRAERMRAALKGARRVLGRPAATMADQLAALGAAGYDLNRPHDLYGGGIVAELEERVASLLGKPAAAYFPTGTMAQQIALRIWSERSGNPTVALHPAHHLEEYERRAFATLSGLRSVWPTMEPRHPSTAEIRDVAEPFATLVVELPLRTPGFLLPTWDELSEMCAAARDRGAYVHFDGARLWESAPHLGQDLPTIAALADSVYVSFYKSLGALSGAALAGPADVIAEAKAWRHRHGGQIFSQWPAVVSALAGIDKELPELPSCVAHARRVASALAGLPGAVVHPAPPHTHQFQVWLPYTADVLNAATLQQAEQDKVAFLTASWRTMPPGDRSVTEVTVGPWTLDTTGEQVVEVGTAFLAHASRIAAEGPQAPEVTR